MTGFPVQRRLTVVAAVTLAIAVVRKRPLLLHLPKAVMPDADVRAEASRLTLTACSSAIHQGW
jgi:hypothetical protein